MERAPNPWDRHYRYHEAPWRGERPVKDLLPWLGSGPVLELGCGNGKLLAPLEREGVDSVGLDISFHALRRLGRGVLADAAGLPFQDACFSAVLDVHCTTHLLADGRMRAAREATRVLRPGGHLVVERLTPDDLRAGQGTAVEPGTRRLADGRTTHVSDEADLRAEHAGLEAVAFTPSRRRTAYRGARVTRAWLRGVFRKAP